MGRQTQPVAVRSSRGLTRLIGIGIASLACLGASATADQPKPENAVQAILAAFDRFPVVALGMAHWQQDEAELTLALIRNPSFAKKVNDIVVECGNSLYQATLDRYIEGGDVPLEQLQLVWRNTTQPGRCDPPQHKELVDTVREVNSQRSAGPRLRVLAGDPPIDWDKIQRHEDLVPFMNLRDVSFASVVEQEVLARRRKALLVIGAAHVFRRPISWASSTTPPAPTVTMLIESKYQHSVYVISPHDDFGNRNHELEPRLANWPIPSLLHLRNTWLGSLDAGIIFSGKIRRVGSDPSAMEDPYPGSKLQDLSDGYLYLGPVASISHVEFPREIGTEYSREIERRERLSTGGPAAIVAVPSPPR